MNISVVNWKGGCGKTTLVLSLMDVLEDKGLKAQIVEHDLQGTVGRASDLGGRHKTTPWKQANAQYVIHDLPPYNNASLISVLESSDLIIIPLKVSDQDLLSANDLIEYIAEKKLSEKTCIVMNEVRKPPTNLYKVVKNSLIKNYSDIRIVATELSNLSSFRGVLRHKIKGKAYDQICSLMTELDILSNKIRTKK